MRAATVPSLLAPGRALRYQLDRALRYQLAYRFRRAARGDDLRADEAAIRAALPTGAAVNADTYLDVPDNYTYTISLALTFLLAFSLVALAAMALIAANMTAGAVAQGARELGVMKALGFAPWQVLAMGDTRSALAGPGSPGQRLGDGVLGGHGPPLLPGDVPGRAVEAGARGG